MPSEGIYIAHVSSAGHLVRFQASSNGWASGASRDDAVLQALYEVVERDASTLWHVNIEQNNVWPKRFDLERSKELPLWLHDILNQLNELNLRLFLFDMTTDTGLPVAWAVLCDVSLNPAGIFSGYGCTSNYTGAVTRAILEAIQSRACYVAGARDDLFRRTFLLMKRIDQGGGVHFFHSLPVGPAIELEPNLERTAKEELEIVVAFLHNAGFSEFYVRDCVAPYPCFNVVKVIAPCLEQWRCGYWQPSRRTLEFIGKYVV